MVLSLLWSVSLSGCHTQRAQRVQKHRDGGARVQSTSNQVNTNTAISDTSRLCTLCLNNEFNIISWFLIMIKTSSFFFLYLFVYFSNVFIEICILIKNKYTDISYYYFNFCIWVFNFLMNTLYFLSISIYLSIIYCFLQILNNKCF